MGLWSNHWNVGGQQIIITHRSTIHEDCCTCRANNMQSSGAIRRLQKHSPTVVVKHDAVCVLHQSFKEI